MDFKKIHKNTLYNVKQQRHCCMKQKQNYLSRIRPLDRMYQSLTQLQSQLILSDFLLVNAT
jgi:hypothetical protein